MLETKNVKNAQDSTALYRLMDRTKVLDVTQHRELNAKLVSRLRRLMSSLLDGVVRGIYFADPADPADAGACRMC